MKSTPQQIRERFDNDVERFSNLETAQVATMDARLCMEMVTHAAAVTTPRARDLLDVGCGAGNYTLMMLARLPNLNCTLVDLSAPMLARAQQRIAPQTTGTITTLQTDMRQLNLHPASLDIILAAATLHHLRTDDEWHSVFQKFHTALRPAGSFWIFDMIEHTAPAIHEMMRARHGEYLVATKPNRAEGEKYRDHVFAYIEQEDTPRSLAFQMTMLERVGFAPPEVLHKNALFAAFGAQKP